MKTFFDFRWKAESLLKDYQGPAFEFHYWDDLCDRFGKGEPFAKIHFKTRRAFVRSIMTKDLGFGEGYASQEIVIDGDLERLMAIFGDILKNTTFQTFWLRLSQKLLARSLKREKLHIEHHYGLGNEFYQYYLDKRMQYSCGYFRTQEDTLDQAQEQKIDHITRKLFLKKGQRLLDIGCGWGHLMFEAASRYGVECIGITLCDNQAKYIREMAKKLHLPVEVRVQNYLELPKDEKWERLVSVGMMCHIGQKRIHQFWDKVSSLIAPKGIALLHCVAKMKESSDTSPFVQKYIFPGYWYNSIEGMVTRAVARDFQVIDIENLRRHYTLTLHHWRNHLLKNKEAIQKTMGFTDEFMRAWEFYLAIGAAGFASGTSSLIQMVVSKGINDEYPWTRDFLYSAKSAVKRELAAIS